MSTTITKQYSKKEDEEKNNSIKIILGKSLTEKNLLADCKNKP